MYTFTSYTNNDLNLRYIVGFAIANLLTVNTFVIIWFVPWAILNDLLFTQYYFSFACLQLVLLLFTIGTFGTAIHIVGSKTSLTGEILGEWMLIKSQFGRSGTRRHTLCEINAYFMVYHLVLPVVIYTLIRYRKAQTFRLDPEQFNMKYANDRCPGHILFKLIDKEYDHGHITDSDLADHFIKLGDRYFVKNSSSALYMKLSYTPERLLLAFKTDSDQVLCILLDLLAEDIDMSSATAHQVIKSSFVIA
jgi:hypothetical protein